MSINCLFFNYPLKGDIMNIRKFIIDVLFVIVFGVIPCTIIIAVFIVGLSIMLL